MIILFPQQENKNFCLLKLPFINAKDNFLLSQNASVHIKIILHIQRSRSTYEIYLDTEH